MLNLGSVVAKAIAKAEAVALKMKGAIVTAMKEVDGVVLPEAEKLEPLVAQVAGALIPGGAVFVGVAYGCLEALAKVVDAGGAAAEENLKNLGLDGALVESVKQLIPHLKAASNVA